jgi:hypothetical protein
MSCAVLLLQPLPRLAIISRFPPEYTGITANLSAEHTNDLSICVKIPSAREGANGVSILQPGPDGKCGVNNSGVVPPGTYILDEKKPPKDTVFKWWECYNITLSTVSAPVIVDNITLAGNSSVTCVAVFDLLPLPKLAIIAQYPPGYTGPPASLLASNKNATCSRAPPPVLGKNGVTIDQPGAGLCGVNGTMPPGTYNLDQDQPSSLAFDMWVCYDIYNNGTNYTIRAKDVEAVLLERDDVVTCVAIFVAPKLALTSKFPDDYNGPSERLALQLAGLL